MPGDFFRFELDHVSLVYDETLCRYRALFRKLIKNVSSDLLQCAPARVVVCVLPDEPDLANAYYRVSPVTMDEIGFFARDEHGMRLPWRITRQHDANIELDLLFEDVRTRVNFTS